MQIDGTSHLITCHSNLAAMDYDSKCLRCMKIKVVVFLRRKTTLNGASSDEELVALEKADSIREKYKLTRGEIFDRQYESPPSKVEANQGAFKKSAQKRGRQSSMTPDYANMDSFGS